MSAKPKARQLTRDDTILRRYLPADLPEGAAMPEVIRVQCTKDTRDLLHRAGYPRPRTFNFYPVTVNAGLYEFLGIHPQGGTSGTAVATESYKMERAARKASKQA